MGFIIMRSFTEQCFSPRDLTLLTFCTFLSRTHVEILDMLLRHSFPPLSFKRSRMFENAADIFTECNFTPESESKYLSAPKMCGLSNWLSWCDHSTLGSQSLLWEIKRHSYFLATLYDKNESYTLSFLIISIGENWFSIKIEWQYLFHLQTFFTVFQMLLKSVVQPTSNIVACRDKNAHSHKAVFEFV